MLDFVLTPRHTHTHTHSAEEEEGTTDLSIIHAKQDGKRTRKEKAQRGTPHTTHAYICEGFGWVVVVGITTVSATRAVAAWGPQGRVSTARRPRESVRS